MTYRRNIESHLLTGIGGGPLLLAVAFLGLSCFCSSDSAAAGKKESLSQKIDADAREIVKSLKTTSYSHKSTIDATQGVYQTDSSGLLDYLLTKVSKVHLQEIQVPGKEPRQSAHDYYTTFHAAPPTQSAAAKLNDGQGGWQHIEKISEARPGDVLAWKGSGHEVDSGHVMIIDEEPKLEPRKKETKTEKVRGPHGRIEDKQVEVPESNRHRVYRVVVIDGATTGHASDTRTPGTGGVGRGTIWIDVDSEGHPMGYRWSSETAKPKDEPMAIGRAVGKE